MPDDPDGGDRDDERANGSDESEDPFESLHDVDDARGDDADQDAGATGDEEPVTGSGTGGDHQRGTDRQSGEVPPERDRPQGQPRDRARNQPVGREGGRSRASGQGRSAGQGGHPQGREADRPQGRAGPSGGQGRPQPHGQPQGQAAGRGQAGTGRSAQHGPPDEERLGERATEARGDRILAHFLDFTFLTMVAFVTWFAVLITAAIVLAATMDPTSPGEPTGTGGGDGSFILVTLVTWMVVSFELLGYYGLLDATGGTMGKRLAGLSVVTGDGDAASMKHTTVRTVVLLAPLPVMAAFGSLIPGLGFFIAVGIMLVWLAVEAAVLLLSSSAQRLGDKLANTYVVERD